MNGLKESKMIKFIGYCLFFTGGVLLADIGYDVTTWQFWAISICFIAGSQFRED